MFHDTLFVKKSRLSSTAFFLDFDGTIFAPDKIVSAPLYNSQTNRILHRNNIPLTIVTGRSSWTMKSDIETLFLGLQKPDAVVAGAGSIIYYRLSNGQLALDTSWDTFMRQTKIQWKNSEKATWNRKTVLQLLHSLLPTEVQILPHKADRYLIRLYVKNMPIKKLVEIKKTIESHFTQGIQVIFTEKLLQENSLEIFSGNMLIVPETAGKDKAITYLLKNALTIKQAYCFGDATIDIPMLTLKSVPNKYTMHTYGVNLTPLAKKTLTEVAKENPQLHIINTPPSPQAILEIAKKMLSGRKNVSRISKAGFSPAQNTPARLLLRPFESFLDTFFDQNLTANQISFKGLDMVKKSIDLLYTKETPRLFTNITIWRLYTMGNLTDIFDGIRARQTNTMSNTGQLTDVFCDRAKEFYQLYKRGEMRVMYNPQPGYQTFLTAISCILPSIARAQAEIAGVIVKEQDAKGGSMMARTRKLFLSFFYETVGLHEESFSIDQRIYQTNIATYQNRMAKIKDPTNFLSMKELTPMQQKACQRFLLLVQLLQEENQIIQNTLKNYPTLSKHYTKEFSVKIQKYTTINVPAERKKYAIKTHTNLALFAKK